MLTCYDAGMRRTQIQLDETSYELLRRKAHERRVSMAAVVREAVGQYLTEQPPRKRTLADFKSIGIAAIDDPEEYRPISENHDAYLGDALYEEIQEKAAEFRKLHGWKD